MDMKDTVLNEKDIKIYADLTSKYNFSLKISYFHNKSNIESFKAADLRYFFSDYCCDWTSFLAFIDKGATDIYVVNDLAFELDKLAPIAREYNVKIRVFPNVAQETVNRENEIVRFFIRPEDISAYEPYVDVFEIFGSPKEAEKVFKVYAKDKFWVGYLNALIYNFEEEVFNSFLSQHFGEKRISCGKKCLKGGYCNSCHNKKQTAKVLDKIRKEDKQNKIN